MGTGLGSTSIAGVGHHEVLEGELVDDAASVVSDIMKGDARASSH